MSPEDQLALLKRGTSEIINEKELAEKLEAGKPLVIKAGFDPTAPDIHLGHTVLLRKLAHFQQLGHKVIFLIGDFTAMIGDPSGQNALRPPLTPQDVLDNAKTFATQISSILDLSNLQIRRNSEWLGQMRLADFLGVSTKMTVPRLLERDDFTERLKKGDSLTVAESMYPLLQAYDSVALEADVEIGGVDQKFNLLMGRVLQERFEQKPQVVITMPLLEGLDGAQKMSKSLDNYVGIQEAPDQMYGKLMSVSDALMEKYYELLTDEDLKQVKALHPMEAKKQLAALIVKQYHGEAGAKAATEHFKNVVQNKELPSEMEDITVEVGDPQVTLAQLLELGLAEKAGVKSRGEFRRLVTQGGIKVDEAPVKDLKHSFDANQTYTLKVGKRKFFKLAIKTGQ